MSLTDKRRAGSFNMKFRTLNPRFLIPRECFFWDPLYCRALPGQFQPHIREGDCCAVLYNKFQSGGCQLDFGGCQFPCWRLNLSWGCAMGLLWVSARGRFVRLNSWEECKHNPWPLPVCSYGSGCPQSTFGKSKCIRLDRINFKQIRKCKCKFGGCQLGVT